MNVPAYTLEAVKTVFMDLFCTPKSSVKNPSLRPSGHGGSTSRTFIVEDYSEDEYAQWATDEATSEQSYVDDERLCFWTWDHSEYAWQCRPFTGRQLEIRKGKGKGKRPRRTQQKGRAFLCENKHRIMSGSLKKMVPGGSKDEEGRKVHRKVEIASLKKVQAVIAMDTQAEARNGKEKAKKVLILHLVCQPQKHPVKKRIISPGNQMIGMMIIRFHLLFVVHLHAMAREIRPGWHHSL